ncbi:membrane protein [Moraxella catarrhalis]|uniref:MotA/TolQ/ExbB proton channel family protein n=1 Tax=Moraxella catarrhalis TaxID=480 RepID=UPI000E5582B4|nr:MotA/TolQ/ExbB proton channel family protein [Moraxella catarrhalis]AXT96001.1 membrane protein [Moraxella catarrhalis]MCG6833719.1 MotA/TolQ/ExbB proton channel family protein [Moraxella catarrhalis]
MSTFALLFDVITAPINMAFLLVMLGLFIIGWVAVGRDDGHKPRHFIDSIPTLLTSIGILGTFFGIVLALLAFDDSDIKSHINDIISGMKTAFITSVTGLLLSIILKIWASIHQDKSENLDLDQVDASNILKFIEHHLTEQTNTQKKTAVIHEELLQVLTTHHEYVKQNNQQFAANLWDKLEKTAQILTKSATEEVILALNQLIKDFNHQLTEQFGENFKQLNHAVFELIQWQENYKQQLEQMQVQYQNHTNAVAATQQAIDNIHDNLSHIAHHAQSIPDSMERLAVAIELSHTQIDTLYDHLAAFADMKDKAVAALPSLSEQIDTMLQGMDDASQKLTEQFHQIHQAIKAQPSIMQSTTQELKNTLERLVGQLEIDIKNITEKHAGSIKEQMNQLSNIAAQTLEDISDSIEGQINNFNTAEAKKIESDLQQMGSALISMTSQFTKDYKELVNHMNNIIRHGRPMR